MAAAAAVAAETGRRHGLSLSCPAGFLFTVFAFLTLAAVLVVRFVRTGGRSMLAMMGGSPEAEHSGHHRSSGPEGHDEHHHH